MNKFPIKLAPSYKDYLWGGTRLKEEFNKDTDLIRVAESWECSTHPDGVSTVDSGEYRGRLFTEYLNDNPDSLGDKYSALKELPILIKLIDAKERLSIQVHPDDEYAAEFENGARGKTEMWYVLDAKTESRIIFGIKSDVTPEMIRKAVSGPDIGKYLNKFEVSKDDVFFINPGTIHAIGAGCVVAEIQESSNLTYRIYDYDRRDSNGNLRELHTDKALEVARLEADTKPRQPLRVLRYKPGMAREILGRCKYFEVYRMIVNNAGEYDTTYRTDNLAFSVFLCVDGEGRLIFEDEQMPIKKGECVFIPADSVGIRIEGSLQLLEIRG